jgi:hypothetical protein
MTLAPEKPTPASRYSWAEIWTAVLTRPSMQTFQEILSDPGMSRRRAYTWVVITLVVTMIFVTMLTTPDPQTFLATMPEADLTLADAQNLVVISALCSIPIALVMGLAGFAFMVWLVQFAAKSIGGSVKTDSGTRITYSFAAIQAPLNILSLLFLALPAVALVQIVSLVATIYQFVLMALAVRTVYELSFGRAVAAVVITFVIIFTVVLGLVLVLGSMM